MNLASHKIVTGQPWPGARIHAQGATFSYSLGDFLLHIETPSMRDATEILEGKGFMALTELPMGGLWFAVFRFDNITFDCPFHAGLLPEEERRPFTIDEGKYLGIPMAVVHSVTGTVIGQRYFTVSPIMAGKLRKIIDRQCVTPITKEAFQKLLKEAWERWEEPAAVMRDAEMIERIGVRVG